MNYLHTMLRISNIEESLNFYCHQLGLVEVKRKEYEQGRFTLIFLAAPNDLKQVKLTEGPMLELTYNWDPEPYSEGRHFGHIAYSVDNIYAVCQRLQEAGIVINRPPRDGYMAFIRSPDQVSIELLQQGAPLRKQEPWLSAPNVGHW